MFEIILVALLLSVAEAVPIDSRIIDGTPAEDGQFPWQVALYGTTNFCSGSLISDRWILTAAHCIDGPDQVQVHLGTIAWNGTDAVVRTTSTVIVHEYYDAMLRVYDIGLLELSEPVTFNSKIQPIALNDVWIDAGVEVTSSGWGATSDENSTLSAILNYVSLTTISNDICVRTYGKLAPTVVCAQGTNLESTCLGDDGGPLMLANAQGTDELVGVYSFGSSQGCEKGLPTTFIRVSDFRDWIQQNSGI